MAGDRLEHELRRAAADAVRVDRGRRVDRAAVDAAGAEQAEDLVGAAHELRALRRDGHRDRLAVGHEDVAGPQHLGVGRGTAGGEDVAEAGGPGHRPVGGDDDAGGASAAVADDRDPAGGVERADRAEQRGARRRCRRPRRRRRPTRERRHRAASPTAAPRRPSGSGSDQRGDVERRRAAAPRSRIVGRKTSSRNRRPS